MNDTDTNRIISSFLSLNDNENLKFANKNIHDDLKLILEKRYNFYVKLFNNIDLSSDNFNYKHKIILKNNSNIEDLTLYLDYKYFTTNTDINMAFINLFGLLSQIITSNNISDYKKLMLFIYLVKKQLIINSSYNGIYKFILKLFIDNIKIAEKYNINIRQLYFDTIDLI